MAVPSPLSTNVTPLGSGPDVGQRRAGACRSVVTVKVPGRPDVKVAVGAGDGRALR